MAAYHRVYDSHHYRLTAGISSGTLRSVIEYGLPLLFMLLAFSNLCFNFPTARSVF